MRLVGVLGVVAVSLAVQVTLARFAVGGRWVFDVVLVGVVYAALQWGPLAGMLAGTLSGIVQDGAAGGLVGATAFPKTVVGYMAGTAGARFVVARTWAKAAIAAVATLLHRLLVVVLAALIDQAWPAIPWTTLAAETILNAGAALVAFGSTDSLPGMLSRAAARRRAQWGRRRW